jgi:glycosyltransferase involved in cell wall biosynthesis
VLYEARNRALGWPRAIEGSARERLEVRRLARRRTVPAADVTTVIPTFRRPEAVRRAVLSALAQDLASHTVLVVDDGGGLPELPSDPRVVAVSLRWNTRRPGIARNVGIALARSPYVAFLDDDNEWYPHHLAAAVRALSAGADLVYTGVQRVLPDGTEVDVLSRPFDRRSLADEAYVDSSSIVVRASPRVRFSRLLRTRSTLPGEDWELVWRLSRRCRTAHVPLTTVRYVVNPDSYFTAWSPEDGAPRIVPDGRPDGSA